MADFDPYYKWLGIPPDEQPPNHYRLLGVTVFEQDPDVIDAAASKQAAYLQGCATGPHVALSQKLLSEIAAARLCLFAPASKAAYDATLRDRVVPPVQMASLPAPDSLSAKIQSQSLPPSRPSRRKSWWQNKPTQFSLFGAASCVIVLVFFFVGHGSKPSTDSAISRSITPQQPSDSTRSPARNTPPHPEEHSGNAVSESGEPPSDGFSAAEEKAMSPKPENRPKEKSGATQTASVQPVSPSKPPTFDENVTVNLHEKIDPARDTVQGVSGVATEEPPTISAQAPGRDARNGKKPKLLDTKTQLMKHHPNYAHFDGLGFDLGIGDEYWGVGIATVAYEIENVNRLQAEVKINGRLKAYDHNAFVGFLVDYHTPKGYRKRVALSLGMYFRDRHDVPEQWGTRRRPNDFVDLTQRKMKVIELREWAPPDWDGKVWFTVLNEHGGKNVKMTGRLRIPGLW